jgi:hypothetical protein
MRKEEACDDAFVNYVEAACVVEVAEDWSGFSGAGEKYELACQVLTTVNVICV